MRLRFPRHALAGVALAAALACTPRSRSAPRAEVPRTILVVDNQSFNDNRMYVMNGSQRMRIGYATSKAVTSMTIPSAIITGARILQFIAEPMAGDRGARSDQIYVSPGDTVRLMIPPT